MNPSTGIFLGFCFRTNLSDYSFFRAVHNEEVYLNSSRTSMMEHFCENSEQLKAVNYFRKKTTS